MTRTKGELKRIKVGRIIVGVLAAICAVVVTTYLCWATIATISDSFTAFLQGLPYMLFMACISAASILLFLYAIFFYGKRGRTLSVIATSLLCAEMLMVFGMKLSLVIEDWVTFGEMVQPIYKISDISILTIYLACAALLLTVTLQQRHAERHRYARWILMLIVQVIFVSMGYFDQWFDNALDVSQMLLHVIVAIAIIFVFVPFILFFALCPQDYRVSDTVAAVEDKGEGGQPEQAGTQVPEN